MLLLRKWSNSIHYNLKRNIISLINIKKNFEKETDRYIPYVAIGELYKNNKFIVLSYEISSLETQPGIAIFSLDGNLISKKTFFSIGGDLSSSTTGELFIDKDLTIHVEIEELYYNEIVENKSEKYRIDLNGYIKKIK